MMMRTKSDKTLHGPRPKLPFLMGLSALSFVVLLVLGLLSVSPVQANETNGIRSIDVEGENDTRVIRIQTMAKPTFTVFRLSDPIRVVVDISGGDFSQFDGPISLEDGSLGQIATRQFRSNGFIVGRIIIGFEKNLDYTVNSVGNSVVVRTTTPGISNIESAAPPPIAPVDRVAAERFEEAKLEVAAKKRELKSQQELAITATAIARAEKEEAQKATELAQAQARQAQNAQKQVQAATAAAKNNEIENQRAHRARLAQLDAKEQSVKEQIASATKEQKQAANDQKEAQREKERAVAQITKAREAQLAAAKKEKEVSKRLLRISNENSQLEAKRDAVLKEQKRLAEERTQFESDKRAQESIQQASFVPQTELVGLKRLGSGEQAQILLQLSSSTPYNVERIENPPRLVIDLKNTVRKTQRITYRVRSPHIRKVRLGDHPHSVRAVFDLKNANIAHQVEDTEEGILISLRTIPKKNSIAKLKDVVFEADEHGARIILDVNPQELPKVDTRSDKAWVLTLNKTQLNDSLERSLDTTAYNTVVRMVSTYRDDPNSDTVKVVASLSGKASQTIKRANGKLIWEIQKSAPRLAATTTAPRTAGFATQAATLARSAPKQSRSVKKRISIDMKDANVINVLRLLSEVSGENIISSDEVGGNISLSLRNVPWDDVLDTLLKTKGYGKVRQRNIIRVAPISVLRKEREDELARRRARIAVEETAIKIITVNYAIAKDIDEHIKPMLSERGTVQTDERTNTIIVEDIVSNIDRLVELTRRLDRQTPQVLIEARIVEAASNHLRSLGIQWGGTGQMTSAEGNATGLMFPGDFIVNGAASGDDTPNSGTYTPSRYAVNLPAAIGGAQGTGLGFIFGSAGGSQLLALRLTAMEENGNGRVISSPRITTLDNRKAMISQGVKIPVSVVSANGANTQWVKAHLRLEVTPHVTNDGSILMAIKVEKSEPDFTQTGAAGDPTIKEKSAETEVLVKDGDTTVIGGIYTRTVNERSAGVPFLSNIPILGWLFRKSETRDDRSELLIFITPRIVNRDESLIQIPQMTIDKKSSF